MKKVSIILIMCLLMSFGMSVIASANEYTVEPRYNNANAISYNFCISDDNAIATVDVNGFDSVTTRITVNVKLQKRVLLGLWWNDVEEWNATTTNNRHIFEFVEPVGNGTYRCSFEITVEGNGGSADVITDEITVKN